MITYIEKKRSTLSYRVLSALISFMFIFSAIAPPTPVYAQLFPQGLAGMPLPGTIVPMSPRFTPAMVTGITVHPENPLEFDFIIGSGDDRLQGEAFEEESTRLIKYFLAALTVPEEEMWVNLSPYEKDRIIPKGFGDTEMGRDLLAQDYILKQLTASLMYPENELGDKFWKRVRAKAFEKFGVTEIPMNTFNKVWIVPEEAIVYEHGKSAFVVKSHLKVMLEEDYTALQNNFGVERHGLDSIAEDDAQIISGISSEVVREVLIPEIEKEVNHGKSFANLRQIYNSVILATWYKQNLQNSLLGQVYVGKNKTAGVDVQDKQVNMKIYGQYLKAFKKGVYNYIREDYDSTTETIVPRKYFSGGTNLEVESLLKTYKNGAPLSKKEHEIVGAFLASSPIYNGDRRATVNLVEVAEGSNANDVVKIAKKSEASSSPVETKATAFIEKKARIAQIETILGKIAREKEKPGSEEFPYIVAISDYHGAIELFLDYIADSISQRIGRTVKLDSKAFPGESLTAQLKLQDVNLSEVPIDFFLLGDFLDRGDYGVKSFRVAEELVNIGIGHYVTGNHDLWAFLNLSGFHLPIYSGYNFYGHTISEDLVNSHWNDEAISQNRMGWWTARLAEYNAEQKKLQAKIFDGKADSVRGRFKEKYLNIKDQLSAEEKSLWQDLVGYYFDSADVYTGFNAIGMMSVQWWQEKVSKISKMLQKRKGVGAELSEITMLEDLFKYAVDAKGAVIEQLEDANRDGKWWWKVFNDINHQNYISVEWWGKDWSSHEGWGTGVIEEINKIEGWNRWDQTNYIENPHLQDLAHFYRKHFTLYRKDAYGSVYTHGWLPVDPETGEIRIVYKNVVYAGAEIWKGLDVIQSDVRDLSRPLSELHEALELVNAWYADKTTTIKPADVRHNINKIGLEKIYKQHGIRVWFTGHNPQNRLQDSHIGFKVEQGKYVHISVDKGMSWEKFDDVGGYVFVDGRGIYLRGFSGPDFSEIVYAPDTLKLGKGKGGRFVAASWGNSSLDQESFTAIAEAQLSEELDRLKTSASSPVVDEGKDVGGINLNPDLLDLQIKRDGNGIPLPVNLQPIHQMRIDGFVPIIINVTPVASLPLLLGFADTEVPVNSADTDKEEMFNLSLIDKYRKKYIHEEENIDV